MLVITLARALAEYVRSERDEWVQRREEQLADRYS